MSPRGTYRPFYACRRTSVHGGKAVVQPVFGSIHRTCLSPLVTDRAMEAWYHSSLHEWPPTGGSHGKPHRTTKILSYARRCGSVAARGARAAGCEAADHRILGPEYAFVR